MTSGTVKAAFYMPDNAVFANCNEVIHMQMQKVNETQHEIKMTKSQDFDTFGQEDLVQSLSTQQYIHMQCKYYNTTN